MFDIYSDPQRVLLPNEWENSLKKMSKDIKEITFISRVVAFTSVTFRSDTIFYEAVTLESKGPYRMPLPKDTDEFRRDLERCNIL